VTDQNDPNQVTQVVYILVYSLVPPSFVLVIDLKLESRNVTSNYNSLNTLNNIIQPEVVYIMFLRTEYLEDRDTRFL
jgi:hypothetical protein